jgi:ATP-binding cassette subfamily B protein RaxB
MFMLDSSILRELRGSRRGQLPLIMQAEAAECGLACLAMVASYHGFHTDLAALRARFHVSSKGMTLAGLAQMADALQLASRPLRVELEDLKTLPAPCILHWEFTHFVVLERADRHGLTIHDPARGIRKVSYAEAARHFTGVVLELSPSSAFAPAEERRRVRLRDLMGQIKGLRRSVGQILLLALALEVFAVIGPFFMQWVVDDVVTSADRSLLTLLGAGFILLILVQQAVAALRSWAVLHASTQLNFQWLTNVFTHLLKLPSSFFEKRHMGDVYSRFQAITSIQRTLTTSFVEVILDGIMSVATLLMMLIYSPLLAALALVAVGLYGALRWAWYRPLRNATEEQIVHAARQQSHFLETVRGVRAIQLFSRETERRSAWLNLLADQVNADVRTQKLNLAYRAVNAALFGIERIAIIWIAALLVLDNHFSVGMLFAFIAYKDQFAQRVSGLIDKAVELKMMQLQGERLADLVFTAPESTPPARLGADGAVTPSIELRNVRFRYADCEPYVLDGVNLKVEAGECVALVGPSGCGKTTLLKVMLGLLQPQEGEVLIGGIPLRNLGALAYRRLIGTVLQDDQLFAGSLLQNICFFDSPPDENRAMACARLASIHDEIAAMPMGYNTLIGDMGTALSGGQQQRALLARALYKQPSILFLDESTSHLDVARERVVNAAIQNLKLTRILIAHRPETIAMAERVIRLDRGTTAPELRRAG